MYNNNMISQIDWHLNEILNECQIENNVSSIREILKKIDGFLN